MKHTPFYRQTWVEIDLGALGDNCRVLRGRLSPSTKMMAAVKANAYGHGLIEVSKKLIASGVDCLGVACIDEAVSLRQHRIKAPILNLGVFTKADLEAIVAYDITVTVADLSQVALLDACARRRAKTVCVHAKIDTGMGRLGVWCEEAAGFIRRLCAFRNLSVEGIYTHFPSADCDEAFTNSQIALFGTLIEGLVLKGVRIPFAHAANSMAVIGFKNAHFNLVRPGLALYGLHPKKELFGKLDLKPVLSFKTRVTYLKDVLKGRSIGYGRTFTAKKKTRVATLPVGYGDGYNRLLSNKGRVLIKGKFCPVVGTICMDQTMVDIGRLSSVKPEDEVVLIGRQKGRCIRVEDIAHLCRTIPYEVVCWISPRVPRVIV